ncbi:MAG: hemolysin family protein [Oscillospiraceae bacterium]|nr:hemolysin family protein [Oscillospiraceae bacterium]
MDPDGLSTLLFAAGGAASLLFALFFGAAFSRDDRDGPCALGFSDAAAGLGLLFAAGAACFLWGGFGLMPWWGAALCALAVGLAAVLLAALGGAKGEKITASLPGRAINALGKGLGFILAAPAKLLFQLCGLKADGDVTEDEVLELVDSLAGSDDEESTFDESQAEMISGIFELDDVTAGDIMTHRTEVVAVEENTPAGEVIPLAAQEGLSRLPVYQKSLDNVTGILYVKDLLSLFGAEKEQAEKPISAFMRGAMFVPESCRARELLLDFKLKHMQIAVVVDEYGGTSGIVTMEDILEEIVGNIQDEFDNEEELLTPCEGGYICDGSLDLEDLFDALDIELPAEDENGEEDEFDSVSGLITQRLGRIPTAEETVELAYGGVLFRVLEVSDRRILKVRCTRLQAGTED